MPIFFTASILIVLSVLGMASAAAAQIKDPSLLEQSVIQTAVKDNGVPSASDYYFQSWNCLTDF